MVAGLRGWVAPIQERRQGGVDLAEALRLRGGGAFGVLRRVTHLRKRGGSLLRPETSELLYIRSRCACYLISLSRNMWICLRVPFP